MAENAMYINKKNGTEVPSGGSSRTKCTDSYHQQNYKQYFKPPNKMTKKERNNLKKWQV